MWLFHFTLTQQSCEVGQAESDLLKAVMNFVAVYTFESRSSRASLSIISTASNDPFSRF